MGVLVCFYVIQRFYFRPISHFHLQKIPNSEMIAKYLSLKPLGNFALVFVSAMSKKKKKKFYVPQVPLWLKVLF